MSFKTPLPRGVNLNPQLAILAQLPSRDGDTCEEGCTTRERDLAVKEEAFLKELLLRDALYQNANLQRVPFYSCRALLLCIELLVWDETLHSSGLLKSDAAWLRIKNQELPK